MEATTYDAGEMGGFTLTISGLWPPEGAPPGLRVWAVRRIPVIRIWEKLPTPVASFSRS